MPGVDVNGCCTCCGSRDVTTGGCARCNSSRTLCGCGAVVRCGCGATFKHLCGSILPASVTIPTTAFERVAGTEAIAPAVVMNPVTPTRWAN